MKRLLWMTGLIFSLLPSTSPAQIKEFKLNEFRYSGGAIVCLTDDPKAESGSPCLRIGDLKPGMTLKNMEDHIKADRGIYNRTLSQKDGSEIRVYTLPTPKSEKSYSYLAIYFKDGLSTIVQLTGTKTDVPLDFSSIQLGDSQDRVRDLLGPPSSSELETDMPVSLWSYYPFPFSLEMLDGKVYSIRVRGERPPEDANLKVDPTFNRVMEFMMHADYPEKFKGEGYHVRVVDTAKLEGFWPGADLFFLAINPNYRQTPTILLFRAEKNGKISRITEGLAPGPLVPVSGDYLDCHTMNMGVDLTVEGDPMEVVKTALGQKTNIVRYAKFYHMDTRDGSGGYLDMSEKPEYRNEITCEKFEFSKVENIGAGSIKGGNFLAALVGGKVYFYRIESISGEGFLKKTVEVAARPKDFTEFASGDNGELEYKSKDGKLKEWNLKP